MLTLIAFECLYLTVVPHPFPSVKGGGPQGDGQEGPSGELQTFSVELEPNQKPGDWLAKNSVNMSHLHAAESDPRWTTLTETDLDARTPEEFAAAKNFLGGKVLESITSAEQQSADENRERLKGLSNQLNQVATVESVENVSAHLSKLLGTGPRATAPAKEPIPGEFDLDTAQLHDVRREMLADGSFKYVAILIDAAGRTQETEMAATEGESAFKTFELIKQNPLLERVYRGVVMSLLDKMLKNP